ncbi:MAG: inositol monophosphatase family protein [Corynebacterium sp.]|jgi:fructose-1,6-bisphosphatase/inositol monophosphatase family enzyme|uniref:inositol monophosphatase family protein n=1 Tax=unclassified Corynebacterium TaxID=2624378 RepID=UPI00095BEE79|nr:inositol monophosphatase family protein [Corynebacterium sp. CNJ-954]OLT55784.1 fructose 1,6-bisphosphatase [Corynebacterium sp. CNJ-954]
MNSPIPADALQAITKTFIISHDRDDDGTLAQALVYNAGRLAWRMREAGVTTEFKTSVSDVVTAADRAAEDFVAEVLRTLRPQDGLLGEEGASAPSESGRTWVIDPVDGTYNFTTGSDYWCSALALVDGDPEDPDALHFGAVHRPAMGYTWFGGPGIPTTLDGAPVGTLADLPPEKSCLTGYLHPTDIATPELNRVFTDTVRDFATVRFNGSASVDMAGVASGNAGCWFQHSVLPWDLLPGRALIEGAGGRCARVRAGGKLWSVAGSPSSVGHVVENLSLEP